MRQLLTQTPQFLCLDGWGCPEGYVLLEDSCVRSFNESRVEHFEAELKCRAEGGTLAKFASHLYAAVLTEMLEGDEGTPYWTGFHHEIDEANDPFGVFSTAPACKKQVFLEYEDKKTPFIQLLSCVSASP